MQVGDLYVDEKGRAFELEAVSDVLDIRKVAASRLSGSEASIGDTVNIPIYREGEPWLGNVQFKRIA